MKYIFIDLFSVQDEEATEGKKRKLKQNETPAKKAKTDEQTGQYRSMCFVCERFYFQNIFSVHYVAKQFKK